MEKATDAMDRDGSIGESERWLSAIAGGMLALSSLRRRDMGSGLLFAAGAAFFLFRGITGHDGLLRAVAGGVGWTERHGREGEPDAVDEAGMESFPASDPPSFTPTTGASVEGAGEEIEDAAGGD